MSKEESYFNTAKSVSKLSNHKNKLGAVLVRGHRIVSSGYNSIDRYSSIQAQLDDKQFKGFYSKGPKHAELDALLPFYRRHENLSDCTLYVYREHKNGDSALAKPCSRCMQIIKACNIKKIKYTTEDGYAEEHIKY